jgi:hypothetical protein
MVSKLVLAAQESWEQTRITGESQAVCETLRDRHFSLLDGLGSYTSPSKYGAFPTDAYSHTPKHAGAQQPGMTGQVKEDIQTCMRELGVKVELGCIHFEMGLLSERTFLASSSNFKYVDTIGIFNVLELPEKSLAYTLCQTPIVYVTDSSWKIEIYLEDGEAVVQRAQSIPRDLSQDILPHWCSPKYKGVHPEKRAAILTVPPSRVPRGLGRL